VRRQSEERFALEVMQAVIAAGITPQVLMVLMEEMGKKAIDAPQYEEAAF
jgi:hypothetical protein